jgi:hypothetical protein
MSLTQAPEPLTTPKGMVTRAERSPTKCAKLTAAQIDVLRAASQREDRLVALGKGPDLKTGKTVAGLLRRGLLVEVPAKAGQPVWRHDEQGRTLAAAVTQAGLAALQGSPKFIPIKPAEVSQGGKGRNTVETRAPTTSTNELSSSPEPAKGSRKRELVLALLRRQEGASVLEMMAVTGWLPHTTRAALTGLRHRGMLLERRQGADGRAIYRIVESVGKVGEAA